nr:RNA-directed DNA polymerase, eukaryota [Tanacetum cinerariifolium]
MGSYRTKEDDVYKIFTSVFITNFPESCSAKELFQSCKQYGHVLDTFIPNKRSKTGRRFGFVRFINVFNEERLVNNLCTVWIDRFKLHVNIARFYRTPFNEKKSITKKACRVKKDTRVNEMGNTYVHVVKDQMQPKNKESKATPALIRAKETPGWVPDFMEENNDEEQNDNGGFNVHESGSCGGDSDVEGVLETIFEESRQKENNLDVKHTNKKENHSGDPFSIYKLLKKKKDNVEKENNSEHSMKYPPGFTPKEGTDVVDMHTEESRSDNIVNMSDHNAEEVNNTFSCNCTKKNSKEDVSNSVCSGHFKTSMVPRTGGSILSLMYELVKVGQVMGYKMDGCMSNMTEIIESQGVKEVNFLALQETKMENIELFSVKMCWGNFAFDYVHSDSVGEVVIMGDFNEVRYKSDRFGSVFNVQGANVFNSFITNARLKEVPLGGSSFTWCHKSATKMSKLDIFFISKIFLNTCSNITAITLERNLSDHRPILLRESHFDYVPTPFRFFHHWIEMEDFSKFVEDVWREGPCDESNEMINMMIKLKYLKTKIQEWNKKNMLSAKNVKEKYKDELEALKAISDKGNGNGNVEVVNKIMEVVNTLQKIDKICSSKMAQKAKSFLNIRGIMVDGMWIESPNRVKGEFFHHFSSRFDKPGARRVHIEMRFSKTLTCDQQVELESDVSNEEIKRAVWDYGIDKSPGPDVFTFGFYHRFWNLIENDVYDAVKYFFTYEVIPKGCNSSGGCILR